MIFIYCNKINNSSTVATLILVRFSFASWEVVTLAQIAEGKKLVEPAEAFNEEGDKVYFLDQEYSGLYDENV